MKPVSEPLPPPLRSRGLSRKKLLLSKWTAATPSSKEKHFVLTRIIEPDRPGGRLVQVELAAVLTGRSRTVGWEELTDRERWHRGWI